MPEDDLYGNLGAISDASWLARWSSWDKPAQDAYMASVAIWGPLHLEQMEHLIQGFLPPTHGWLCPPTILVEYQPLIYRLRQDIDRGALPKAPAPEEFAAWCDQNNLELPTPLVLALQAAAKEPKVLLVPQSPIVTKLEPWVAGLVKDDAFTKTNNTPKRGRPSVSQPTNTVLCNEGDRVLMDAARRGELLTLREVAKKLQAMTCGQGKKLANIERRLKGKLHIDSAKETASKHQVAEGQKRRQSLY